MFPKASSQLRRHTAWKLIISIIGNPPTFYGRIRFSSYVVIVLYMNTTGA